MSPNRCAAVRFVLAAALFVSGCASYSHRVAFRPPTPRVDMANVVLIQNGGLMGFVVMTEDRKFRGELTPRSWFETSVPPGEHTFVIFEISNVEFNAKNPQYRVLGPRCIPAKLVAGKTYYLQWRFISPAHGAGSPIIYATEEGLDPGTPIPPSEVGWHMRVKRRREQLKMDPWAYLKDRDRMEPALEAGQKATDAVMAKLDWNTNPKTGRLALCEDLGLDDSVAEGDYVQ